MRQRALGGKRMIKILLLLLSTPAWAISTLDCVSNQGISYSDHHRVGGVRPYPGMITNLKEVKSNAEVLYRLVTRQSCNRPCEMQQPELVDILPAGFSFEFYPVTKIVVATEGSQNDPIFRETHVIQFRVGHMPNIWMLCNFERILAP